MNKSILVLMLIASTSNMLLGKSYQDKAELKRTIKAANKNKAVLRTIEENVLKQLGSDCESAEDSTEKFLKCVVAQLSKPSSEIDGTAKRKIVKACCVSK